MRTMKINYLRDILSSAGIIGIFLLASTHVLATPPQDKAMKDDGVGIGMADQINNENSGQGNTNRGEIDPAGTRDRDPAEIESSSGTPAVDDPKKSQGQGDDDKKVPANVPSGTPAPNKP